MPTEPVKASNKLNSALKTQEWILERSMGFNIFEASIYRAFDDDDISILLLTGDIEHDFWYFRERIRLICKHPENYTRIHSDIWTQPKIGDERILHVPHVSVLSPGKIAFTPSAAYGRQDRQVVTSFGKYLTKYYSANYTAEEIRNYANELRAATTISDVLFAETGADIEDVYMRCTTKSCMSHGLGHFRGHIHPVHAYGNSDVSIAYIEDGKKRITARSAVWQAKKLWVRVYGDDALRIKLESPELGYTQGSLDGARLTLIANENGDGYIAPYIDGGAQGLNVVDTPEHKYLVVSRGSIDFGVTTNGVIGNEDEENDDDYFTCDNCNDRCENDDSCYSDFHDATYCNSCAEDQWVYAYYYTGRGWNEAYINNEDVTWVECIDRHIASEDMEQGKNKWGFVELSDEFYDCEDYTNENYSTTESGHVILDEDAVMFFDGEKIYYTDECETRDGFEYPKDEETKVDPETGDVVAYDDTVGVKESEYHAKITADTELQTTTYELVGNGMYQGSINFQIPVHNDARQLCDSDGPGVHDTVFVPHGYSAPLRGNAASSP